MTVATALAVSWKPLTNSKPQAIARATTSRESWAAVIAEEEWTNGRVDEWTSQSGSSIRPFVHSSIQVCSEPRQQREKRRLLALFLRADELVELDHGARGSGGEPDAVDEPQHQAVAHSQG